MLKRLKAAAGRYRQIHVHRYGHVPGLQDVRVEGEADIWVCPNFYYYQALGDERPAWLPLYPAPRMVQGTALNYFTDSEYGEWPAESDPYQPGAMEGNWLRVVGQYVASSDEGRGAVLNNEHVQGGWLLGNFEASAVWDLIVVPSVHINRARLAKNPTHYSKSHDGFLAWGSDLWLGNTGLRADLLVGKDAAQNPPKRLC